MAMSWICTMLFVFLFGCYIGNAKTAADMWAIPSLAVPSVVGVVYALRNRNRTS
jgi:hypothetical protein